MTMIISIITITIAITVTITLPITPTFSTTITIITCTAAQVSITSKQVLFLNELEAAVACKIIALSGLGFKV